MLGQLLLRGDKKRKLIDEGFNRHANHDTNLPEWFADDERKYRGPAGYAMDLPEDMMEQARHRLTLTLPLALTLTLALALTLPLTPNPNPYPDPGPGTWRARRCASTTRAR